jgi:hypothetical protein
MFDQLKRIHKIQAEIALKCKGSKVSGLRIELMLVYEPLAPRRFVSNLGRGLSFLKVNFNIC